MALEAGKHVLLEKPGANNPANLARIVDAVDRTGGYLTVGYMIRQSRAYRRLKTLHESGVLGRTTVGRFHVSVPAPDPVTPWFNLEDDIGGVLFEDGCHMLDLIIDLLGKPRAVGAFVPKYDDLARRHGHRYEDSATCILEWDELSATMSLVGWEANDWLETWELGLFGEAGTALAGPLPARLDVFLKEPAAGYEAGWTRHRETDFNVSWLDHEAKHVWHAVQHRSFFRAELERFIDDVRTGGSPEIPASHALAIAETAAGLYEAARTRRTVDL
jgi:predicted dehydrogenase